MGRVVGRKFHRRFVVIPTDFLRIQILVGLVMPYNSGITIRFPREVRGFMTVVNLKFIL
ncbi:hypothetical protein LEP1GSC060_2409 [Leptospira weilii serovar Ranarum str. ICFT]|uniref:Uncharacterized protein n=1 Tax=Leptospira weilii serovar Ranarum str. ICFT TaxID=1218598 RepID=N1WKF6_9LEPT|nr:hypothetical protein LEP1GSC060_2409 [Leptospira weilii serovar Ranarum str. ICFT]